MRAVVFCLLIVILLACDNKKDLLVETLSKTKGNFALAFKDLQTGEEILINEHRLFHAASTMKTPVMIEVFKEMSLTDSIEIKIFLRVLSIVRFLSIPRTTANRRCIQSKKQQLMIL